MRPLDQIDHFVVLMLENRAFDTVFGRLPHPDSRFDGLPAGAQIPGPDGVPLPIRSNLGTPRELWMPEPDPGESFTDINQQLFNGADTSGVPAMNGFALNYAQHGGRPADIAHAFTPAQLPALSALALDYAVCDRWFASAPCQTWPNRFFLHTGTAGGYENNDPPHLPYKMPTIFNALQEAGADWSIYFHDFPQSLTLCHLWPHLDNFRAFKEFLTDAALGQLPAYSFIEPRYFADEDWPNDMHPPHCVTYGDRLVASVYQALRASPCWSKTLLVITFDEHGGCYDHVPPPAATPPEARQAGQVFGFDRYGVRVPAVLVSPWIRPGTLLRPPGTVPFDHTSVIATLRQRFGISQALTARDAVAPDFSAVLNLAAASDAGRPANLAPLDPPASDDQAALEAARAQPLSDFQSAAQKAIDGMLPLIKEAFPDAPMATLGLRPLPALGATLATEVGEAVTHIGDVLEQLLA